MCIQDVSSFCTASSTPDSAGLCTLLPFRFALLRPLLHPLCHR